MFQEEVFARCDTSWPLEDDDDEYEQTCFEISKRFVETRPCIGLNYY